MLGPDSHCARSGAADSMPRDEVCRRKLSGRLEEEAVARNAGGDGRGGGLYMGDGDFPSASRSREGSDQSGNIGAIAAEWDVCGVESQRVGVLR